jgi:hypothetical protein
VDLLREDVKRNPGLRSRDAPGANLKKVDVFVVKEKADLFREDVKRKRDPNILARSRQRENLEVHRTRSRQRENLEVHRTRSRQRENLEAHRARSRQKRLLSLLTELILLENMLVLRHT